MACNISAKRLKEAVMLHYMLQRGLYIGETKHYLWGVSGGWGEWYCAVSKHMPEVSVTSATLNMRHSQDILTRALYWIQDIYNVTASPLSATTVHHALITACCLPYVANARSWCDRGCLTSAALVGNSPSTRCFKTRNVIHFWLAPLYQSSSPFTALASIGSAQLQANKMPNRGVKKINKKEGGGRCTDWPALARHRRPTRRAGYVVAMHTSDSQVAAAWGMGLLLTCRGGLTLCG